MLYSGSPVEAMERKRNVDGRYGRNKREDEILS